jgi:Kef-type K+ transport system membrane component KefB
VDILLMRFAAETAGAGEAASHGGVQHFGLLFLMLAIVLIAGKLGNFVEKFGQPGVIGELLAGIVLAAVGYAGWGLVGDIAGSQVVSFLASFGAVLLLFSIGLESNIHEMKKVGPSALLVALIGVIAPFVLGAFVLGPLFYGGESLNARLFLGASLVATSVGITASVFRALKLTRRKVAKTVLGAAVIDDVLGLIVLAVVSALAAGGSVTVGSVAIIAAKSFGFLGGSLFVGTLLAKPLSKAFSYITSGIGMKVTLAIGFALVFGYIAELFGLEPIIGAFAAGLLLEEVHFNSFDKPEIVHDLETLKYDDKHDKEKVDALIRKHQHGHVEDLISSISHVFVPVFFVYTGLQVDIASLLNVNLYLVAIVISVVAIITKFIAGFGASGSKTEKMLVGAAMVPRGEVGLIFAATGKSLGVLSDDLFSVIILVVIITTFIAPPIIGRLAKQLVAEERATKSA